jgi:hypothetical protein
LCTLTWWNNDPAVLLQKIIYNTAVKFQTNEEATEQPFFPPLCFQFINGFDEFYHGWGSGDTDVHVRLKCGHEVRFMKANFFSSTSGTKKSLQVSSGHPYHNETRACEYGILKAGRSVKTNNFANF